MALKKIKVGNTIYDLGGSGFEIIDITDLDTIPEDYQDSEKLKICYLRDDGAVYHLSYCDGSDLYFECIDELSYKYLIINYNFRIDRTQYQNTKIATEDYVDSATDTLQATINENIHTLSQTVSTKQDQLTAGRNIVIEEDGTIGIANPNNCKVVAELPELTPELADEETIYSYEGKLYNILYDTELVRHDDIRLINSYQALPYKLNGMGVAAIDNDIYILGGYIPQTTQSDKPLYKFNTITKAITSVIGSPYLYTEDTPLLAINRTLYWDNSNAYSPIISSFNIDTQVYNNYELDHSPATSGANMATVVGTDIYYISISGTINKFDTVNHTFSQYDQLNTDVDMGGCAVATYGSDIYIFGGIESNAIIKYTPAAKTQRVLTATIPGGQYADAAIVVWEDKILLIGGHDDGYAGGGKTYFTNIYSFDPATETLTELDITLAHNYSKDLMAVAVNNSFYVIGGSNDSGSTNLILEYSNFTTEPTNIHYQQLTYGDASFNPYFKDKGLVLDELADEDMSGGMWVYTPVRGE